MSYSYLEVQAIQLEKAIKKFRREFTKYARREYNDACVLQPAVDELMAALPPPNPQAAETEAKP